MTEDDSFVFAGQKWSVGLTLAAVSGQRHNYQILNPEDSGVNIFIDEIFAFGRGGVGGNWSLRGYHTDLANAGMVTCNAKFGAGPCKAHARWQNTADGSALLGSQHAIYQQGADQQLWIKSRFPILVLTPGMGMLVTYHPVNYQTCVNVDWREIPIE